MGFHSLFRSVSSPHVLSYVPPPDITRDRAKEYTPHVFIYNVSSPSLILLESPLPCHPVTPRRFSRFRYDHNTPLLVEAIALCQGDFTFSSVTVMIGFGLEGIPLSLALSMKFLEWRRSVNGAHYINNRVK